MFIGKLMFLINIVALLLTVLFIAVYFDIKMVKAMPMGVASMLLLLYILASFKGLKLIDLVGICIISAFVIYIFRMQKNKRNDYLKNLAKKMLEPSFLVYIVVTFIMIFAVRNKLTTWWDDYNFWSTDAKAVYYLSGFAGKYRNAASEFGDYPPMLTLIKWWFLHMKTSGFDEGLMFGGYYFFLWTFLSPLLELIENKSKILLIPGAILLILLPCTVEAFWCDGACADLCMGIIYGRLLICITEMNLPKLLGKNHTAESGDLGKASKLNLVYIQIFLFLSVMMLCKTTSFIWASFLFIYWCISYRMSVSENGQNSLIKGGFLKKTMCIFVAPVLVYLSWYIFCVLNRRVSKLTGNSLKMATGKMNMPGIKTELLKAYLEGFLKWPLHRYENGIINLSPLVFIIICIVSILLLAIFKLISRRNSVFLLAFCIISGFGFYAINLVCHLTVFATEEQYLEAFAMVSSMERYGSPFTMGMIILIFSIVLSLDKGWVGSFVLMAFVLLTTDYESTYRTFIGYNEKIPEILEERQSIITDENKYLIYEMPMEEKTKTARILYIRDVNDYSRVRDTYLNFMASPLSIVYTYENVDTVTYSDMIYLAKENHSEYIFFKGKLYTIEEIQNKE